jgi:glycosyltransferase involved in cell wall biosynthesis|tara:strand:- start:667 stop:2079 length:1413 start_codon:yes stop_codon:yes gene_type:complete
MSKKKILLLSDDLRMSSGVGTMSKEFVLGTLNHYDWVQIGGAITHPENGKRVDMGEAVKQEMGIDGNLTIYPISGYGSPDLLRQVMDMEKPDAILHYTDPRFWGWLYQMEHEVRQEIPIFYYNIWDDWPAPQYNENFYECSDLIMNISKQTYAIVNEVSKNKPRNDWDCTYLPHGVSKKFYPISKFDDEYKKVEATKNRLTDEDVEFVLFYNNRNIRRKMTSDVILAYKTFCDKLTPEEAKKVCLLMHTQPVDENGTDLPEVARVVCPDYKVYFSNRKLEPHELNHLFNVADVTINIASNEGFGLGTCESLMAGTPIIVNVTGGLQDQCGFRLKKYNSDKTGFTHEFLTHKDYTEIQSLHDWRKWENNNDLTHGDWVKPVWPRTRALQGSPVTPYIFDDRADWVDVSDRINDWYVMDKKERETCGLKGREFVMTEEIGMSGEQMSKNFIKDMDKAFEMWKPRKRYSIFKA